ncbi:MAG: alkane 1-monooxygenase [Bacteroidia bacterium]|nr:alkane 1-monooxygenase [Bacteroidia bacterium]
MGAIRSLKYSLAFLIPLCTLWGIWNGGWFCWVPAFLAFIVVPVLELWMSPDPRNLQAAEADLAAKDKMYDLFLYLLVPLQWFILFEYLLAVNRPDLSGAELAGMSVSMGLLCGIVGINVGHELGHRSSKFENLLAKILLLSSLYLHFFIEHNRGHHKRVGTPDDPASARYGESLYAFWVRSVVMSYFSAWELERVRLQKLNRSPWSLSNQMIHFHVVQLGLLAAIAGWFGTTGLVMFLIVSLTGILLLEGVNYIEHYGLARRKKEDGSFGRTLHCHSWNSDHVLGRILLFELSRHSDHHYKASKKYQLLEHVDDSPQMPTGYPGMIILALIPPLWYRVMHPILEREIQVMPELDLAR